MEHLSDLGSMSVPAIFVLMLVQSFMGVKKSRNGNGAAAVMAESVRRVDARTETIASDVKSLHEVIDDLAKAVWHLGNRIERSSKDEIRV